MEDVSTRIEELIGKRVTITVRSGAIYSGNLYRRGQDRIVLANLSIYGKNGGWCAPKHESTREFAIEKLTNIGMEERDDNGL